MYIWMNYESVPSFLPCQHLLVSTFSFHIDNATCASCQVVKRGSVTLLKQT